MFPLKNLARKGLTMFVSGQVVNRLLDSLLLTGSSPHDDNISWGIFLFCCDDLLFEIPDSTLVGKKQKLCKPSHYISRWMKTNGKMIGPSSLALPANQVRSQRSRSLGQPIKIYILLMAKHNILFC